MGLDTLRAERALVRDPLGFLSGLAADQGDLARFRVGRRDVLLVTDPGTIREVLVARQQDFVKRNAIPADERSTEPMSGLLLSDDDAVHATARRVLRPAFATERMEAAREIAAEETRRVLAGWHDGDVVDVGRQLWTITVETVALVLLGARFGTSAGQVIDDSLAFAETFRLVSSRGRQAARGLARLPQTFRAAVALQRLRERSAGPEGAVPDGGPRADGVTVPGLLAAAGDATAGADRADEAFMVLTAALETTSTALTWACHLLAEHPDEADRLRADPSRARAVFAETLRLYPPAWYIGRLARTDVDLERGRVAAGTMVLVCPYLVHRDERRHTEPARFSPDRWTGGTEAARAAFAYLPFGGGRRHCLGEGLAWAEAAEVLGALAADWRLEPLDGAVPPTPLPRASLGLARPLRLRARRRI